MPCEDCQKEARKLGYLSAAGGFALGAISLYVFFNYVKK